MVERKVDKLKKRLYELDVELNNAFSEAEYSKRNELLREREEVLEELEELKRTIVTTNKQ